MVASRSLYCTRSTLRQSGSYTLSFTRVPVKRTIGKPLIVNTYSWLASSHARSSASCSPAQQLLGRQARQSQAHAERFVRCDQRFHAPHVIGQRASHFGKALRRMDVRASTRGACRRLSA